MSQPIDPGAGTNAEPRPTGSDIEAGQVDVRLPGFILTEVGLTVVGTPTQAQVVEAGAILGRAYKAALFGIGDWTEYAIGRFGWGYPEIMTRTGLSYSTLTKAVSLCRRFPPHQRRAGVPADTHAAVASLRPADRAALLDRAAREDLPRNQVRAIAQAVRNGRADPEQVTVVTVTTNDPRAAAWSLALAFGDRLPLLVAELDKLARSHQENKP